MKNKTQNVLENIANMSSDEFEAALKKASTGDVSVMLQEIGLPEPVELLDDDVLEDECSHDEHDHGICLDCGEDIMDSLMAKAEAYYEGDR